ncbi:hypothetical protein [Streptomyces collinus]|uniref:hypothetical protein n=1 Tax=Streptomyces collinus TaxID=42684 RepID=UPI003699BDE6
MKTLRAAAFSGMIILAISGCGVVKLGSKADHTPPAATSPNSDVPRESTPSATSEADRPDSEADRPDGENLKIGEGVKVNYETKPLSKKETKLSIAVMSIKKGSIRDMEKFDLPAQVKESEPFYVTVKFRNKGPFTTEPGGIFGLFKAYNENDDELSPLNLIGEFKKCDGDTPKSLAVGAEYTDCRVYTAPKGQNLKYVEFGRYDADLNRTEVKWNAN